MPTTLTAAPHLRTLNHEQRRAVLQTEGPVLVLAGAGSGKTKMLVHRIVHLIRGAKVMPARIAAVTFTNRAADEMRERVRSFAGDEAARVTVSTFHALGARILREHGARIGLPPRFAIYAAGDQLGALRAACGEISIDDDAFDMKRVLRQISHWKNRGVAPAAAKRTVAGTRATGTRTDDYAVLAADAYPRYEETLRACGAVDFDDLLVLPVRLLESDEDVCRSLWRRWHYLVIDEYQDTNGVQLQLARLLAGSRRNLCVVGDDDQSIYAFRGADVNNILEFERHFPGAAVIRLEQNYRSTQRILAAANAVIAGNARRHVKRLRTENGIGALIDDWEHADDHAEAESVAREIAVRRYAQQRRWGDFAVLYRTNPQARPLEEALRAQGVPYRVVGGTAFFDRKEVADGLAYLRVIATPDDEIALRRIINYPARGIGRTTVLRIVEHARARRVPFARALADPEAAGVSGAPAAAIGAFLARLDAARTSLLEAERLAASPPPVGAWPPLAVWARQLFAELGLEDALRDDPRNARSVEARIENLRDLAGSIARCERKQWAERLDAAADADESAWAPPTLADALARLALAEIDDRDEDDTDDANAVTLMTLHSAKGLEFEEVYLVGLEEGILPHARSLAESEAGEPHVADATLAEERRLLYVGMTRAKQRLVLSRCAVRRRHGEALPSLPSRYLEALPAELLNVRGAGPAVLTADESASLRRNFFRQMKDMLGPEPGD
jgi:DNA helicase II / ATP-dependent DNA helicase PcrA